MIYPQGELQGGAPRSLPSLETDNANPWIEEEIDPRRPFDVAA